MNTPKNISHENFTKLIILGSVALGGHYISLMEPGKENGKSQLKSDLKPGERESISERVTKKVYLYVKSKEQEGRILQGLMDRKADMGSDFAKEQVKKTIEEAISGKTEEA